MRHLRSVEKAVFSPDDRRVLTASLDRTLRIWDAKSGAPLTESLQHGGAVSQATFSPDGTRILSAFLGGSARLWDAATGRPLTEWLKTNGRLVRSARFDPTGREIATGTQEQVARVWGFPPVATPVPEWFIAFAEAAAGIRLGTHGNVELVPQSQVALVFDQVRHRSTRDAYARIAQWFVADPARRPLEPF